MGQMSRIHPLDKLISDESVFLLEALVPFIEFPYKKMLVLFIKYREIMSIMKSLNDRDYISSCGFDCHPKNTEEMLAGMCDFLPENISASMKQMKQMMSMMEVMNQFQGKDSNGSGKDNPFGFPFDVFNNNSYTNHQNEHNDTNHHSHKHDNMDDYFNHEHSNEDYDYQHDNIDNRDFNHEHDYNHEYNNMNQNNYASSESDSLFDSVLSILDNKETE